MMMPAWTGEGGVADSGELAGKAACICLGPQPAAMAESSFFCSPERLSHMALEFEAMACVLQ